MSFSKPKYLNGKNQPTHVIMVKHYVNFEVLFDVVTLMVQLKYEMRKDNVEKYCKDFFYQDGSEFSNAVYNVGSEEIWESQKEAVGYMKKWYSNYYTEGDLSGDLLTLWEEL